MFYSCNANTQALCFITYKPYKYCISIILQLHCIIYEPCKYYILSSHNLGIHLILLQRIPYFRYFSNIIFKANCINLRFFQKSDSKNGQFSFFKFFQKNMGVCKRPKIGHQKNDLSKHILDRTNIGVLAHFKILFLGKIAN